MTKKTKHETSRILSGVLSALMLFSIANPVYAEGDATATSTPEPVVQPINETAETTETSEATETPTPEPTEEAEVKEAVAPTAEAEATATPEAKEEETKATTSPTAEPEASATPEVAEEGSKRAENADAQSDLKIYVADDAADMAAAVASLSDNDSTRLVVTTDGDITDVIKESGKAVYYDGAYVIEMDNAKDVDKVYDNVAEAIGDENVVKDDLMKIANLGDDGKEGEKDENKNSPSETKDTAENSEPIELGATPEGKDEVIAKDVDEAKVEENRDAMAVESGLANGKVIAVIDTGANSGADKCVNLTSDPDEDKVFHGTHVVTEIRHGLGVDNAQIISIKAFNDDGTASISTVYAAVKYAMEAGVDFINISASIKDSEKTDALRALIEQAIDQGITVVAAAGNDGGDAGLYFPGNMERVVTVGTSSYDKKAMPFSNMGDCVDWYTGMSSTSYSAAVMTGYLASDSKEALTRGWSLFSGDEITERNTDKTFYVGNGDGSGLYDITDNMFEVDSTCTVVHGTGQQVQAPSDGHTVFVNPTIRVDGQQAFCTQENVYLSGNPEGGSGTYECHYVGEDYNSDAAWFAAGLAAGIIDFATAQLGIWNGGDTSGIQAQIYAMAPTNHYSPKMNTTTVNSYVPGKEYRFTDTSGTLSKGEYNVSVKSVSSGNISDVSARRDGNDIVVTVSDQTTDAPDGIVIEVTSTKSVYGDVHAWLTRYNGATVQEVAVGGYVATPSTIYDSVSLKLNVLRGGYSLAKTDFDRMAAPGQGDATLAGATFNITNTRSNKVEKTITTDAQGKAATGSQDLKWGYYKVTENTAPTGYYKNELWSYEFHVDTEKHIYGNPNDTDGTVVDEIWRGGLSVNKNDSDFKNMTPQGDATLAGTVYDIYNVSAASIWHNDGTSLKEISNKGDKAIEVIVNGKKETKYYGTGNYVTTITTDETGNAKTLANELSYGSYLIIERTPPNGYLNENTVYAEVTGTAAVAQVHLKNDYQEVNMYDDVPRGQLILYKTDVERLNNYPDGSAKIEASPDTPDVPQGDARFEGAEFTIYNDSPNHVMIYDGNEHREAEANGGVAMVITTDAQGLAKSSLDSLPFGTYHVKETKAPEGYLLNTEWRYDFRVTEDGEIIDMTTGENDERDYITGDPEQVIRGGIELTKFDVDRYATNSDAGFNVPQGNASLKGAEYSIYNISDQDVLVGGKWIEPTTATNRTEAQNIDESSLVTVIVTDETGRATTSTTALPYGTYLVKETKASEGYLLNDYWYSIVEIREDGVILNAVDANVNKADQVYDGNAVEQPIRGGVKFLKTDVERDTNVAQGDAVLSGAEISIYNISKYSAYGASTQTSDNASTYDGKNADGNPTQFHWVATGATVDCNMPKRDIDLLHGEDDPRNFDGAELVLTLTTNENGEASTTADALPYGSYYAIETKPSVGYMLNTQWIYKFDITEDGVIIDATDNASQLKEQVIRGDVRIYKEDLEMAELNGVNRDNYINAQGGYVTGSEPNTGDVNASQAIGGKDHEGTTNLSGIKFKVTNESVLSVLSDANELTEYQPGEFVVEIETYYNDELEAYVAETFDKALPYGSYTIQETKTNKGYLLTDGTPREFKIDKDGEIVEKTRYVHDMNADGEKMVFRNQISRNDFRFTKTMDGTNDRVQTLWVLESETGEKHVIVTDENGEYVSNDMPHTSEADTNQNDWLLEEIEKQGYEGMINLTGGLEDESIVPFTGLWFGLGEDGAMATINSELGSLPYGKYVLHEVRTDTNEGRKLENWHFFIQRDNKTVGYYPAQTRVSDIGTITNFWTFRLKTFASNAADGKKTLATLGPNTTIVDEVTWEDLDEDMFGEYTVKTWLVNKDNGKTIVDAQGNEVSVENKVTLDSETGSFKINLTFDSSNARFRRAVVFEEIFNADGERIGGHMDINDEDQMIDTGAEGVEMATTLTDTTVGDDGRVYLTDIIYYDGFETGNTYVFSGKLVDKATGDEIPVISMTPATKTVANKSQRGGTVEVKFVVNRSDVDGKTIVCFETATVKKTGEVYLEHADINDEDQTLSFRGLATTATNADDGTHVIENGSVVTIDDEVAYTGLEVGKEYTVRGTIHVNVEGKDNGVLVIEDQEVTATTTFIPETTDGTVVVTFTFDGSTLEDGQKLVVFEQLFDGDLQIAKHEDIEDEGQTVTVEKVEPKIGTTATGENLVDVAGETAKINDVISYKNLTVGKKYTAIGELHIKNEDGTDGGALKDKDGNVIITMQEFTPSASNGTVTVTFEFSTDLLKGIKNLVAFEKVYEADLVVDGKATDDAVPTATHEDIEDEGQTVTIVKPEPSIGTTATGHNVTDDKTGVATIDDVVAYKYLTPGKEYYIVGTLHIRKPDGTDGGVLKDSHGNEVRKVVKFTPETASGTETVTFTFSTDMLKDVDKVVAFEKVYEASVYTSTDFSDKTEPTAKHEDINDEAQTVKVKHETPYIRTTAKGENVTTESGKTAVITDVISYEGLTVGQKYVVSGNLHIKNTNGTDGGVLKTANGNVITAYASFTPTKTSGTVTVTFTFSTDLLKRVPALVVFEKLYTAEAYEKGEAPTATHEDITDNAQTVVVKTPSGTPNIKTGDEDKTAYAVGLGIAAVVIAGAVVYYVKRKKRS